MKGSFWDKINNRPQPELQTFLDDKARSVKERIKEATSLTISTPVCYSAEQRWNLDKLMDHIIAHIPYERRKVNV